jgi:pepF/M3 family oligoendopeptidase
VHGTHWQLTTLYGGLDADDYLAARADIRRRLDSLEASLREGGIGSGPRLEADGAHAARARELIEALNGVLRPLNDISTYLTGFTAVDAFDEAAKAERATLELDVVRRRSLEAAIVAFLGRFDPDALAAADGTLAAHAHFIRRAATRARHLLGDEAEALAAALDESSGSAWERLRDEVIARESVTLALPGRNEAEYGVADLMNLQCSPDRAVRQAAYEAEVRLLDRFELVHAAAMSGIKGQVRLLTERRGWPDVVAMASYEQGLSGDTLAALHEAVEASVPDFRRALHAKARLLGLPRLAWYDRSAPLPQAEGRSFTWEEGAEFVIERFERFSPSLGGVARRAVDEGWVDVPPRKGKQSGAFCASAPAAGASRIMLNWGGTLDDVSTFAHELGHAFHNDCAFRAGRSELQRRTPMTLNETASTFCETLVIEGLLEEASPAERLWVLNQDIWGAVGIVLDIHSRFLFERATFERRAERALSAAELDALMLEAQGATYGDAIDPDARFAKAWAEKSHYYSSTLSFYNFPYTFGYLFALGLSARNRIEGEAFAPRFERFLGSTGTDTVAALARSIGVDVEEPGFWHDALQIVRSRIDELDAAAKEWTT